MHHRTFVLPVVVGLLVDEGRVLLGKRGQRPYRGCWDLPGGVVKEKEDLTSAIKREYKEETGLEVHNAMLLNVFHYPGNEGSRAIFVLFSVTTTPGELRQNPELPILKYFPSSEIAELDLTPWSKHFLLRLRSDKFSS
jgi:8-oxo-dGTP diphosphatase